MTSEQVSKATLFQINGKLQSQDSETAQTTTTTPQDARGLSAPSGAQCLNVGDVDLNQALVCCHLARSSGQRKERRRRSDGVTLEQEEDSLTHLPWNLATGRSISPGMYSLPRTYRRRKVEKRKRLGAGDDCRSGRLKKGVAVGEQEAFNAGLNRRMPTWRAAHRPETGAHTAWHAHSGRRPRRACRRRVAAQTDRCSP